MADSATVWQLSNMQQSRHLRLRHVPLKPDRLFRRAIGRHHCATTSKADVVWFTDVDYFFGPQCLDAVAAQMDRTTKLCKPSPVWISKDHATGDKMLRENALVEELNVNSYCNEDWFARRRQKICIGGVQLIGGDMARETGYFCGEKRMEPLKDVSKGFLSCRCDKWWRSHNSLSAADIDVPNVYRIRHGADGRDYSFDGTKMEGKTGWR
jgi:hypothetical protein